MNERERKRLLSIALFVIASILHWKVVSSQTVPGDVQILQRLLKGLKNSATLNWAGNDPCGSNWSGIKCQGSFVTGILLAGLNLQGMVTADLNKISALQYLQLQDNGFTGSLPSISGLKSLTEADLNGNNFDSIPNGFFSDLPSVERIYLDHNLLNGTSGWSLPPEIQQATQLNTLSLFNTTLTGSIPGFLGNMPNLKNLNLAYNKLGGEIPLSFSSSNLVQFQANNQQGPVLTGPLDVVGSMQSLQVLWLQVNMFTGSIPAGMVNAISLKDFRLNDNRIVGPIPPGLTSLPLGNFTVQNNLLVGEIPKFEDSVNFRYEGYSNRFCQATPGIPCALEVASLLALLGGFNYPTQLSDWGGNDPCNGWSGIVCDKKTGKVSIILLSSYQLNGTISPAIGNLMSLTILKLNGNHLTGTIPPELTKLQLLKSVDLSSNNLSKPIPVFPPNISLNVWGNPLINTTSTSAPSPSLSISDGSSGSTSTSAPGPSLSISDGSSGSTLIHVNGSKTTKGLYRSSTIPVVFIVGPVLGVVALLLLCGAFFFIHMKRRKNSRVQTPSRVVHPTDTAGADAQIANYNVVADINSRHSIGGPSGIYVFESAEFIIPMHVLHKATNSFSETNIVGKGGFGVVYKGRLDDGTWIAVKRMKTGAVSSTGLREFQAEIDVLRKVRHRHLVAILGYCIEGTEKLLVYEYMPQGTLSQHLFDCGINGKKPLSWKQRLSVALDVARGLEYLHGLAHQSFIHRDLKPSNILLTDDFRAKVSDFGLVKMAPDNDYSMETRVAGTFGYLAPEYAVTGRVTTKVDVYSFGVVLMELITGRRALDVKQPEESVPLVTWFRQLSVRTETFQHSIDSCIDVTQGVLSSICVSAELAGHCTGSDPYQRPDMGYVVNVLSSFVEQWTPSEFDSEEETFDLNLTLPQVMRGWPQASDTFSRTFAD
ncbi:hypothetical protein O6H91_10G107200 [Diphasiastrum complanatum]|uniref:Uncharacterized protein n=2 Tax=Diphasiastrum complanatum TaxID=34168 RepID=A0ACC2CKH7_DIPCM|nr:hypothetical protein O6H91_10G107200 [Diphasiastrum complanatum]KAJ7542450.1 hypothetical protein O6H91_10G107200 [Diphasiastrum complanatum]